MSETAVTASIRLLNESVELPPLSVEACQGSVVIGKSWSFSLEIRLTEEAYFEKQLNSKAELSIAHPSHPRTWRGWINQVKIKQSDLFKGHLCIMIQFSSLLFPLENQYNVRSVYQQSFLAWIKVFFKEQRLEEDCDLVCDLRLQTVWIEFEQQREAESDLAFFSRICYQYDCIWFIDNLESHHRSTWVILLKKDLPLFHFSKTHDLDSLSRLPLRKGFFQDRAFFELRCRQSSEEQFISFKTDREYVQLFDRIALLDEGKAATLICIKRQFDFCTGVERDKTRQYIETIEAKLWDNTLDHQAFSKAKTLEKGLIQGEGDAYYRSASREYAVRLWQEGAIGEQRFFPYTQLLGGKKGDNLVKPEIDLPWYPHTELALIRVGLDPCLRILGSIPNARQGVPLNQDSPWIGIWETKHSFSLKCSSEKALASVSLLSKQQKNSLSLQDKARHLGFHLNSPNGNIDLIGEHRVSLQSQASLNQFAKAGLLYQSSGLGQFKGYSQNISYLSESSIRSQTEIKQAWQSEGLSAFASESLSIVSQETQIQVGKSLKWASLAECLLQSKHSQIQSSQGFFCEIGDKTTYLSIDAEGRIFITGKVIRMVGNTICWKGKIQSIPLTFSTISAFSIPNYGIKPVDIEKLASSKKTGNIVKSVFIDIFNQKKTGQLEDDQWSCEYIVIEKERKSVENLSSSAQFFEEKTAYQVNMITRE